MSKFTQQRARETGVRSNALPVLAAAVLAAALSQRAVAGGLVRVGHDRTGSTDTAARAPYLSSRTSVMPAGVRELVARATVATTVPSFARQTGLACSACHYQFPQLTPFGRLFKLNGYTLVGLKPIKESDKRKESGLSLVPIGPVSVMFQTSLNHLNATLPGTQNNTAEFPQQLSLFFGAAISPNIGTFIQATYSGVDGTIALDNTDIRIANRGGDFVYGLTLNNNPTVQDVWQTTPAWGFPFAGSEVTPGPIASTTIQGGLAQQVLGVGAYVLWNNLLFMEVDGYRSAPQGAAAPADSTSTNTINGVSPYWRVALQHQFGADYGMIGTFGLSTKLYPTGVSGLTNGYTDVAADAQYEHSIYGTGALIAHLTYINESQSLNSFAAGGTSANLHNSLNSFQANVSFLPNGKYGVTVGYFSTTGSRDSLLYMPAPVIGSRVGAPNTSGLIEEIDFNPWENTRFQLQFTQFSQFNGASSSYDGSGRAASGNNTIYGLVWLAF